MKEIVIVSGARTPIGTMGGSLSSFKQRDLAAVVIKEAVKRAKISPDLVEDVFFGCCNNVQEDVNVARVALLEAGIPDTVPGVTLNRVCLSGMEAIVSAARKIQCNEADICIAGGVETMSNAPYYVKCARWGARLMHQELTDSMWEGLHAGGKDLMGITAENVAERYQVTRKEQDEAALRSHNNAERATEQGRFKPEIVPVSYTRRGKEIVVDKDEHFRPGMTLAHLEKLKPTFKKDGTVTAGNASGINDGAAAVVVMSLEKAKELGVTPMARYVANGIAGVDPSIMGISPVPATLQALERARMGLEDIQLVELNEAFAAQYVACEKELGLNREITNVNGSGIGLGHPVGCTGTRIVVSLLYEMGRQDLSVGMASLCGGGGIGMTTIWERI